MRRNQKVPRIDHDPALNFRVWKRPAVAPMRSAHTHPDIELNWIAGGDVEYLMGGVRRRIGSGELGVFWGAVPHQLIGENGDGGVWITLPLAWFLQAKFADDFTERLMRGELMTLPVSADRAHQWLADFAAGPQHARLVLLELRALLERMALPSGKAAAPRSLPAARPADASLIPTERAILLLTARYQEPLSVEAVAAEVGLHPKYLFAAFKRVLGTTITRYINQLRIAHAQRLLATTNLGVIDIGLQSGFGSASRFHVAFRAQMGITPARYRKAHQHLAAD